MFLLAKSDNSLLLHFLSDLAVFPAKEQQRLALPYHHVLDLSDENRVVSRLLR